MTAEAIYELFSSKQGSDFMITCGGQRFKGHRSIICSGCPFFEAICRCSFKEEGEVNLQEEDPTVVANVLHFLYFRNYHSEDSECNSAAHKSHAISTTPPRINVERAIMLWQSGNEDGDETAYAVLQTLQYDLKIYLCADMLGIEPLMSLSASKFIDELVEITDVKCFGLATKAVFDSTFSEGRILRAAVIELCMLNHGMILQHPLLVGIMEDHEFMAWRIASKVAKGCAERQREHLKRVVLDAAAVMRTTCLRCRVPYDAGNVFVSDDYESYEDGMLQYDVQVACHICHGPATKMTVEFT